MTPENLSAGPFEVLRKRLQSRISLALSLARVHRFAAQLEPASGAEPDTLTAVAAAFKDWRRALLDQNLDAALDALERTSVLLEEWRGRVVARDSAIVAYRVLWACENAPLRDQTIDSLARFYRLLPVSKSTQSKFEYVLTRLLAGPIGPDRGLAPTEELVDTVETLTASWDAPSFSAAAGEIETILATLDSFACEARSSTDAATFTASALLRRFGSFKASLGEKIFDPRVGVAVVEANVAVINALDRLLAEAGGQLVRGMQAERRGLRPLRAHRITAERRRPVFREGPKAPAADQPETETKVPDRPEAETTAADQGDAASSAQGAKTGSPPEASQPHGGGSSQLTRLDFPTGEVDLSGLEFTFPYGRRRAPVSDESAVEARPDTKEEDSDHPGPTGAETVVPSDDGGQAADSESTSVAPPPSLADQEAPPSTRTDAPPRARQAVQQPSPRALDLGKLPENSAIIERYLAPPRSPEVWQLDLDVFLGFSGTAALDAHAAERRRALELILLSDDLIVARADQEEAPSADHRSRVKSVANAMLLLRTAMRRAADAAKGNAGALEPLLYVSDHLLWERLRLEASLTRNPRKKRPPSPPKRDEAAETAQQRRRLAGRHRRILTRVVGVGALLTTLAAVLGFVLPRVQVDKDVRLIELSAFPGNELFDEARAFRTTLFISANRTWTLLAEAERLSVVRALGSFAADRGLDTVSIIGPAGEPWATFKDDEVVLMSEERPTDSRKP